MYDDIVFDSSAISKIHPRLHVTKVEHLEYIADSLDPSSVQYDGEYFLSCPEVEEEIEKVDLKTKV